MFAPQAHFSDSICFKTAIDKPLMLAGLAMRFSRDSDRCVRLVGIRRRTEIPTIFRARLGVVNLELNLTLDELTRRRRSACTTKPCYDQQSSQGVVIARDAQK
jgi:hypothetical protein